MVGTVHHRVTGGAEEIDSRPFTARTFMNTAIANTVCAREMPNMMKNGQKERTGEFYRAGSKRKSERQRAPERFHERFISIVVCKERL